MLLKFIIEHVNKEHKEILNSIYNKFGNCSSIKDTKMLNINEDGFMLKSEKGELFVPFGRKVSPKNYKNAIMEIIDNLDESFKKDATKYEKLYTEMYDFINKFNSVIISSISNDNSPIISYAPILKDDENNFYIYISNIAKHYHSIKSNPNISLLFIEDEDKSHSVLLRKRVDIKAKAEFMKRDDKFEKIYDKFEKKYPNDYGVKNIRNMLDFDLVKLELGVARYVKGFGAAYDIYPDKRVEFPHDKIPHLKIEAKN